MARCGVCAFNERLRSGVITNLKNLAVTAFVRDAQALFKSRINNTLKKEKAHKCILCYYLNMS